MPLEISYWSLGNNKNAYGRMISGTAETRTLSGTSALSGATPDSAEIVRVETTEAARVNYISATSVAAATTPYMAANAVIEFEAVPGWKVGGKTA